MRWHSFLCSVVPEGLVSAISSSGHHALYPNNDTGSGKPMQRSIYYDCGSPVYMCRICGVCNMASLLVDLSPTKLQMFRSEAFAWMKAVGQDVKAPQ